MAELHVLSALRNKRAELAGIVGQLEQQLTRQRTNLAHLDATMGLFDPDIRPQEIRAKQQRARSAWFRQGECLRRIYDELSHITALVAEVTDDRQIWKAAHPRAAHRVAGQAKTAFGTICAVAPDRVSAAARLPLTWKEQQMSGTNWQLSGEYMESCNCDYLCPCIYTNPQAEVTYDHCTAALIFRVDKGHSGSTDLDGLCFALVIRSGKVMADGNWVFAGVVDARANDAQRQALSAIVSGQAGGPPGMIRTNLVSDFRGVEFKPIDFRIEGLKRAVVIPDILSFEIEGVASRNSGGEPFYIDNTAHPASRRLALARSKQLHVQGFGIGLDLIDKGNNGHFAPFAWAA